MQTSELEYFPTLEELCLNFMTQLAEGLLQTLSEGLPELQSAELASLAESLLWRSASELDGAIAGQMDDGRRVISSLGLVALGSESAFEEPFVEHEGLLVHGRLALHEYVHEALARALERQASRGRAGAA